MSIRALIPVFTASLMAAAVVAATPAQAGGTTTKPQRVVATRPASSATSYFYTTYELASNRQAISWVTCGHDTQSEGCYGSGGLGPFVRACAVAGSSKTVVVADATANGQSALYIYRQEESSTPSSKLLHTVTLAIPASAAAECHLATGGQYAWFGTSESSSYAKVNLKTGEATLGGICGGTTSSITGNDKVVVVSQSGCFAEFDNNGDMQGDGGEFTDEFAPGQNAFRP